MTRLRLFWPTLWLIGGLCLAAPFHASAQADPPASQVFVLTPITVNDNGSTLGVKVPFRLLTSDGNTLDNAQITEMNMQLLNMPPESIDFAFARQESIKPVETPLYVSVLIDTSGSMQDFIESVRTAAKSMVERAPSNVRFRIVTFSGEQGNPQINIRQDFTTDRNSIRGAIDSIERPAGGTCYYDAVHESLESLGVLDGLAASSVRKAVIAFTDGRDMVNDSAIPCSRRTIDEVIQNARSKRIPVYTIGLAGNIDATALRRLAAETAASAAIGSADQLSALFSQAFAGLMNQYEAEFAVLPKGGRNDAFLEVTLAGGRAPVTSAVFSFDSPKNYLPTPTPVPPTETPPPAPTQTPVPGVRAVFVPNAAQPDVTNGVYRFNVSLDPAQLVEYVIVQVQNTNGVQVLPEPIRIRLDNRPALAFDIDMNRFKAGDEYIVQIMAEDKQGVLLTRPPQEFKPDDDLQIVLSELKFKHIVEQGPPLMGVIRSIRPDNDRGILIVELDINQPELVDDYQAFINDETGQKVIDTGMQVYPGGTEVTVPMPAAARQEADNPQPLEFSLSVRLRTADNTDIDTESFGFKLVPPVKPGLLATLWTGLDQNPMVAIAIVVVISSIVLYFVVGRRRARPTYSLARPAEEYTVVAGSAGSGSGGKHQGKLFVDVFETPSPGERAKHTLYRFPCVIGRSSQCDVRLAGDSQLSRRHAQLVLENGHILLTDLGSDNGTFVDEQQIAPNTAIPLSDGQVIRLGRRTKLRVGVRY